MEEADITAQKARRAQEPQLSAYMGLGLVLKLPQGRFPPTTTPGHGCDASELPRSAQSCCHKHFLALCLVQPVLRPQTKTHLTTYSTRSLPRSQISVLTAKLPWSLHPAIAQVTVLELCSSIHETFWPRVKPASSKKLSQASGLRGLAIFSSAHSATLTCLFFISNMN